MPDNLIQKKGESTWYVRLAVPADVQASFGGATVFLQSLKTGLRHEAMERRLSFLSQWKAAIATARGKRSTRGDGWKDSVANVAQGFDKVTRKLKTDVVLGETEDHPPFDPKDIEALYARAFDDSPEGRVRREKADRVYAMTGIEGELANIEFAKEMVLELMGKVFADKEQLTPAEQVEADEILFSPTAHKPKSPITPALLESFRKYRQKANVAAKTIDQQQSKLDKLSAYIREQGKPLDKDTVSAWLDSMALTSKTKAQYLLAGSTFWKWASKYDTRWQMDLASKGNPFAGHDLPKLRPEERAATKRKAYTTDQMKALYQAAKAGGHESLCDLIILGFYTGARIEELAKLRVDSIITVEGVQTVDIDKAKSYAGIRQVPIHPLLSPVIDRLMKASTDGYLLASSGGNKYGIRSDPLSKAFGRLKTSLGFGKQHVFHSVRSTAITLLLRNGVPGPTVANLVGHETGLVTFDVYDQGASPKQKYDAISTLPDIYHQAAVQSDDKK